MRLHTLGVTAFGPFAGSESVDFEALTGSGLFLLHGPTGAGKTSVLDAVCFGLYGVVPGARQQAARLRSDHADPGVALRVVLEVTLRGRRIRLTRSPGWDRPKRRGTGTTREQPKVLLEEVTCGGSATTNEDTVVLSTRMDEAGQLVHDLVGMSAEQFAQVAMLPQGRFAEFLRADAETRRPLLEQLFGTARFSAVEVWLAERRRQADREFLDARSELTGVVARIVEVAGLPGAPRDVDDAGVLDWAGGLLTEATAQADTQRRIEAAAVTELEQSRCAADAAALLAEQQFRHRSAQTRATELAAVSEQTRAARAELAAARRAATLQPLLEDLDRTATSERAALAAERHARAELPPALSACPPDQLRRVAAEQHREIAVLESRVGDVATETRLAATIQIESDRAEQHGLAVARLRTVVAAAPAQQAELDRRLATARVAATEQSHLSRNLDALDSRLCAARRRDELMAGEISLASRASAAVDAAQRASQHWLDLRQSRLEGMAAELARALTSGQPCPVCGASEHPAPARPASDPVTTTQERAAQAAAATADTLRRELTEQLTALREELAGARARAGAEPAADLATVVDTARDRLEGAMSQAGLLPALQQELRELRERLDAAQAELELETRAHAQAVTNLAGARERREELAAELALVRGEDASIEHRRARLHRIAMAAETAAMAAEEAARARAALGRAAVDADSRVAQAGFPSAASALAALRDPSAVNALEQQLARRAADEQAVTTVLADAELLAAAQLPPADRAAAARTLTQAQHALGEAAGARRAGDAVAVRLEALTSELAHRLEKLRPVREHLDLVTGLSTLMEGTSGDNALRMRLSAYVLAARLEQVAAAASERLLRMSSGRFTLVHSDESLRNRGRSGLGLRVCDAWTGVQREPSTLSGGETFFASLALALGLADVVTSEAGGTAVDTLFIDEGFGSLDDETLEAVLDVLDGLRAGGRAVGLVSHVPELRSRIPSQLHVRKGRHGSSLEQGHRSVAGAA